MNKLLLLLLCTISFGSYAERAPDVFKYSISIGEEDYNIEYTADDIILESKTFTHSSGNLLPNGTQVRINIWKLDEVIVKPSLSHPSSPALPTVIESGQRSIHLTCKYQTEAGTKGMHGTSFMFEFQEGKKYETFYKLFQESRNGKNSIKCIPGVREV